MKKSIKQSTSKGGSVGVGIDKVRSKNNRTTFVSNTEISTLKKNILYSKDLIGGVVFNKTICSSIEDVAHLLPSNCVDLLFIDPPYNLDKNFGNNTFKAQNDDEYRKTFDTWFRSIKHVLKDTASVYVCCDWKSSPAIYAVLSKYLKIQNRITWEREKGRGALSNWKNCSEDIWFATVSNNYKFNVEDVKMKKKVIAPYKTNGLAKDWEQEEGGKFRLTYPSNLWTDITIPFWSMPENTDHPTQKPEKLVAKIILASTDKNDVVFDPFLGSGTTSVVSKKLNRRFLGVEMNKDFCYLTEKRLKAAETDNKIQGYSDGVFWERNSLALQKDIKKVGSNINNNDTYESKLF